MFLQLCVRVQHCDDVIEACYDGGYRVDGVDNSWVNHLVEQGNC